MSQSECRQQRRVGAGIARRALYGFVAAVMVLVGLPAVALADTVTNTAPAAGASTTLGSSAAVSFTLAASDDAGENGNSEKCNAKPKSPATLGFTFTGGPAGSTVTATPVTWQFTDCVTPKSVQFSANKVGNYTVQPTITGPGVLTTPGSFVLRVGEAPATAAATTLTLASASAAYDAASVALVATLRSGTTGVANKLVDFKVAGVAVGSASSNASGVATLAYQLNQTKAVASYATSASFAGDSSYAAPAAQPSSTLTVTKANQAITFAQPGDVTFGDAPFVVPTSASSGLTTSLASTTTTVCTAAGDTVTIKGAGTCSLTATQAGTTNWNAAAPVSQSFTVAKASQTVSLVLSRDSATFRDGGATTVTTSASSGLAVALAVTGPCTLSGTSLTATGAGSCVVTADQAGNTNYLAAPQATHTLTINKADQSITFGEFTAKTFGIAPFDISASASSDLPVGFSAAPVSVCSFAEGKITVNGAGSCTVTARQGGSADFNSASDVVRTFAVNKAAQTIDFAALPAATFGDANFPVSATATSGGAVTFSAAGSCDVVGTTVSITGAGDCTITAAQVGSADYEAATSVARTFILSKATQTVTLPLLVDRTYPFTGAILTGASSTSRLPVAVSAGPSAVCTASGGQITVAGAGVCEVTASQAGNANYEAALTQKQSFTIAKADQTITFDALDNATYGGAPFALAANASSGLDVTFASTTPLVCTVVAGPKLVVNAAGDCSVSASQAGNDNYNPAAAVVRSFTVAKAGQTISLALDRATATFGDTAATVNASATSSLPVVLTVAGPCALTGTALDITGAGTCTVTATQAGDGNYDPAPAATATLNISKANQEISFATLANKTFGDAAFTLNATVNSPLAVTYAASPADVCIVALTTVTIVGAGQCTVTAKQGGGDNYNSAPDVAHAFTVAKAAQTITFAALPNKTFGNAPFDLTASASSQETVAFTATGDCRLTGTTGTTVTITGAGSCTVTADQEGTTNILAATPVVRTFTIAKAPQAITFGALLGKTFGDEPFTVSASSNAGLPTAFSSATAAVCTVTDTTVSILTAGTCTVTATQPGNDNYLAATPVSQSFTVAKADQTIKFEEPASKTFGAAPFALRASASSELPVTFSASPAAVCTVSGATVTIVGAGNCSLVASQSGNGNYNAAPTSSHTVLVAKSGQTIALGVSSSTATFGDGPATVTATATSGLPVALTVSGPCSLGTTTTTGTPLTFTGAGNCTVIGNQVGNGNYLAAEQAESVVAIGKASQAITFVALAGKTFGDAPISLIGTASSGLGVVYAATPANVCSVVTTQTSNATLTISGAGECVVTASQDGNDNYNAADDVPRTFTVAKAGQTITFAALDDKIYEDAPVTLGATASSGRTVAYTTSGPCDVVGSTLSITGAGSCTVTATQTGNSNYLAATPVSRTFTIAKAAQMVTFAIVPDKVYGDDIFTVTASSSSGLAVTVSSATTGICTVTATGIKIAAAGTCTLTASQSGNVNYNAAVSVQRSFSVAKAVLTVTGPTVSRVLGAANPTLTPTYTGLVYSDTAASLSTTATCSTTASTTNPVGTYDVTCSGATSGNYTFIYVKGQLTVAYKYSGLLQPINVDRTSAFKSGSTIPVKWQVLDANNVVQDAGTLKTTIRVTRIGASSATQVNETVLTVAGDASAAFRWDTTGKLYIYNLSTKTWAMAAGAYRADVISASGEVLTTGEFQVKA